MTSLMTRRKPKQATLDHSFFAIIRKAKKASKGVLRGLASITAANNREEKKKNQSFCQPHEAVPLDLSECRGGRHTSC